jgi:hypothetical protein
VTPPSVRFLGPKVFLGPIVILISAMASRKSFATISTIPGRV